METQMHKDYCWHDNFKLKEFDRKPSMLMPPPFATTYSLAMTLTFDSILPQIAQPPIKHKNQFSLS